MFGASCPGAVRLHPQVRGEAPAGPKLGAGLGENHLPAERSLSEPHRAGRGRGKSEGTR